MNKSLLFLPDISGFTNFVQTTEIEHSQHVISELLEILIDANGDEYQLAEIEGDALFFYKEGALPSEEQLFNRIIKMFSAFYSHLKLLETNRICPCHACAAAPNLHLKIIAHSAELKFISVKQNRKPFGPEVIEAHRLLKNSIDASNYLLMSKNLANEIGVSENVNSDLFSFATGKDLYDGKELEYIYSIIENEKLDIDPVGVINNLEFDSPPDINLETEIPANAEKLLEVISNYSYRGSWVNGVDKFVFNPNEVTRVGTEHKCIINNKDIDFIAVKKNVLPGQLVYGEKTLNPPLVDNLYQFFIITPIDDEKSSLTAEVYFVSESIIKKKLVDLFVKRIIVKNLRESIENLKSFVLSQKS